MTPVSSKLASVGRALAQRLVGNPAARMVYRFVPRTVRHGVLARLDPRAIPPAGLAFGPLPDGCPAPASVPQGTAIEAGRAPPPGVNVFGHLHGEFGLAESARRYAGALIAAGVPVALNDLDHDVPHAFGDTTMGGDTRQGTPYPTNLVFVSPDYMRRAMESIGPEAWDGKATIGCWFWELEDVPPAWREAIAGIDAIMVASRFTEAAFRRATDKPVFRVPLPVADAPASGATRVEFGLPADAFVFLVSFDFNSSIHRKNPMGAIDAFQRAFPPARNDVRMVVKSSNGHRYPRQLARLAESAAGDPRILIRDQIISGAHMRALQRCCDAYVSLHRAEGFGLGLAECMAMGKPVIGTAWSGNMDFMDAGNSCLVDYTMVPVAEGQYPHGAGTHWAEPDTAHAAMWMRRLVDDPAFATTIGARAARDIRGALSPAAAAEAVVQGLRRFEAANKEGPCPD
jgi:hypothetical protein